MLIPNKAHNFEFGQIESPIILNLLWIRKPLYAIRNGLLQDLLVKKTAILSNACLSFGTGRPTDHTIILLIHVCNSCPDKLFLITEVMIQLIFSQNLE